MKRHPNGWMTESIQELAKTPQFKANLIVLQRIARRATQTGKP